MSLDTTAIEANSVGPQGSLPTPVARVKERRRPLVIALAAAAVAVGALTFAYAYSSASDSHQIVAVKEPIARGDAITEGDLVGLEVSGATPADTIDWANRATVIGQEPVRALPAGLLLTAEQISGKSPIEAGSTIVGVSLTPAMMPSEPLYPGDAVRIVTTPGDGGEVTKDSAVTMDATVVGTRHVAETGATVVDVEVPHDEAAELAARAATGKVALVLDARSK